MIDRSSRKAASVLRRKRKWFAVSNKHKYGGLRNVQPPVIDPHFTSIRTNCTSLYTDTE